MMVQSVDESGPTAPALAQRFRPGISGLIYGGFSLLVVVIVAAGLLWNAALRRVEHTFQDLQRVQRAADLSDQIERQASALRLAVREVIGSQDDPTNARAIADELTRLMRDAAPNLSDENRALVDQARVRLARIQSGLAPGGIAFTAPSLQVTTLDGEARFIGGIAEQMQRQAARATTDLSDNLAQTIAAASNQSTGVGLMCVLLGALIALAVVRRTVVPLRAIVGTMGRVTAGNTDAPTPFVRRRDEVGDIARATEALKGALWQVRVAQDFAQRALTDQRTLEAQYKQLFEQSADGIYQTTPDGRLLRANPALVAMMGYASLPEMLASLGRDVESVYLDLDDRERFQRLIEKTGRVQGFEYRARRKDGAILWLSDSATAVRDENGTLLRYEGMLRDITEQRRAQAAIAESQRHLREVIDTVPASINVKNRALRFTVMNRYMATLLGIEPEDAIGRTTGELLARYSQSKSAEFDAQVLQTRKPLGYYEDQYADASGTMRQWLTTKIPLLDDNGEVDSIVTCALDIGERKRAEAALQVAKDAAEAATETKSQFLAQMSHEIRTPMNGVLGMIEILEHTELNHAQRKLVETVRDSATALLRIINDILDLSKLEAHKLELEEVPISLADILAGVEATLATEARAKGLAWSIDLDPTLPEKLRGDPIRLRQVLLNLAANAVKFTQRGGVSISVLRAPDLDRAEEDARRVGLRFVVRDSGIGMNAETAARLFQPFAQTDASITRRFGGTGLGLSICRRIVTLMNGTIGVSSAPGEGSSFSVALALAEASAESAPLDARSPVALAPALERFDGAVSGSGNGLILVADDHPTNREVILRQLAIIGYAAEAVADGQEALAALSRTDYALLLTDCHMPVIDGFELTGRVRAEEANTGRHLPIIAITANALVGEAERCLAAGMDGYMAKPVQIAQLRAILAKFLPDDLVGAASHDPTSQAAKEDGKTKVSLDLTVMGALFDDDRAALRRTLSKFVDFAGAAAAAIHDAAGQREAATVQAEAERLSSASSTVGARALAGIGEAIAAAAAAQTPDWEALALGLAQMDDALSDLATAVRALGAKQDAFIS